MRKNRNFDEIRKIEFHLNVNNYAEGSCLAKFGNTHVLCTATIDERVPMWLKNKGTGWVTAEYGMLPRSTHTRIDREASKGKQSGRTQEIQRLIGRSLRSIVNLDKLQEKQIKIDCDVIQADGGTRTAAISGAYVALHQAIKKLKNTYNIKSEIINEHIAAISCGIVNGNINIDLDYEEDSRAEVDANFVISESNKFIEIQSTAEVKPFTQKEFLDMTNLASKAVSEIILIQKKVLSENNF
ncbi:MAG: Ribonuclease PH [Alphaproteobacteria bacterium MarineAlpha5_Bin12]|nr:MAG: Ribonuclease PH [Alphaproteobacteria bacterium MarineAlpha5_Bin12]|tara:strand:- start:11933 stop:12655 length:723 start_codon:yes stop_codon:yes gene_type:complete